MKSRLNILVIVWQERVYLLLLEYNQYLSGINTKLKLNSVFDNLEFFFSNYLINKCVNTALYISYYKLFRDLQTMLVVLVVLPKHSV